MRRHSFIDDIIAFEEYMERKEELKKRKEKDKKPSSPNRGLGFFEGLVVAYMAQIMYGPLSKLLELYLQAHGVH